MQQRHRTGRGDPNRQKAVLALGNRPCERDEPIEQGSLARAVAHRHLVELDHPLNPVPAMLAALRGPHARRRIGDLQPHVAQLAPTPISGFGSERSRSQAADQQLSSHGVSFLLRPGLKGLVPGGYGRTGTEDALRRETLRSLASRRSDARATRAECERRAHARRSVRSATNPDAGRLRMTLHGADQATGREVDRGPGTGGDRRRNGRGRRDHRGPRYLGGVVRVALPATAERGARLRT